MRKLIERLELVDVCTKKDIRTFNVKLYGHEVCQHCRMKRIMCLPKYNFRIAGFIEWNLEERLVSLLTYLFIYIFT
jgi:hypothetical protein